MQKLAPSMTRTAFCQNCKKAGYPKKHTAYVVYAGTHKSYSLQLHVGVISKRDLGITPHIFFDTMVIAKIGGDPYCVTKCLCGVIGCGFNIRWENDYKLWTLFASHEPEFTYIKGESMAALKDFKAPEMYLNVVDADSWNMPEIIQEQQQAFRCL